MGRLVSVDRTQQFSNLVTPIDSPHTYAPAVFPPQLH